MASGSDGMPKDPDPGGVIVCSPAEHSIRIHRWKVREGFQVTRNHIILLYHVPAVDTGIVDAVSAAAAAAAAVAPELKRLKATQTGVVRKRLFKDGETVASG